MSASKYNIYIEKGATYELNITAESGIDFNNYNITGSIKKHAYDTLALIEFTCTVSSATQLQISLTATQTGTLEASGNSYADVTKYVYDVYATAKVGSEVIRLLNGIVDVSPEVSK